MMTDGAALFEGRRHCTTATEPGAIRVCHDDEWLSIQLPTGVTAQTHIAPDL
jgi:hypothetical protein